MARKTNTKGKQKEKKNIAIGVAHVHASFNNTIVTIADVNGNTISWASAGNVNFKGSRKGTPFAAQVAADKASRLAQEHGLKQISIQIRGPGSGRETAMRAFTKPQAGTIPNGAASVAKAKAVVRSSAFILLNRKRF